MAGHGVASAAGRRQIIITRGALTALSGANTRCEPLRPVSGADTRDTPNEVSSDESHRARPPRWFTTAAGLATPTPRHTARTAPELGKQHPQSVLGR